jgi:hypothetical protein
MKVVYANDSIDAENLEGMRMEALDWDDDAEVEMDYDDSD